MPVKMNLQTEKIKVKNFLYKKKTSEMCICHSLLFYIMALQRPETLMNHYGTILSMKYQQTHKCAYEV